MIVLSAVTKQFGDMIAVDNLNLEVAAGTILGLVGTDGAGKTTTIRMITGVMDATSGSISLLGSEDVEAVKDQIGYVPQKFSLYGDLTVMENIRLIGRLYGVPVVEMEKKAAEILSFTELLPLKDRLADTLTGSMKQRLALAAGLIHKPKVVFLDEPTTGFDPASRREFWQMLYCLNKEDMTVFVSTPYMDEAEFCNRIAFMYSGKIIGCDIPQGLKKNYPHRLLELSVANKDIKKILQGAPIRDINAFGAKYHLVVDEVEQARDWINLTLGKAGIAVVSLEEVAPTLDDVFVALVGG